MNSTKKFLDFCLSSLNFLKTGKSIQEIALMISSAGIGLGLWKSGSKEIKDIIEVALDLEVSEKAYKGDIKADWKEFVDKIETEYEKYFN